MTTLFVVEDDPVREQLGIRVAFSETVRGEALLAECRFFPRHGAPELPAPTSFDFTVRTAGTSAVGKAPPSVSALINAP